MGWFRKINKNGEDYKPIGNVITATSLSIAGPDLADGDVVRVMFTTDIAGSDTSTPLALTWNSGATPIPVKAMKNGSLVGIYAIEYAANLYRYISAYATLELAYDATNAQFVVVGNPVVLSGSDYTIYADGKVGEGEVGEIKSGLWSTAPYGWLLCQGQTLNRADYPKLVAFITDNNLIGSGKPFGAGNGSTTFENMDLRNKTVFGVGSATGGLSSIGNSTIGSLPNITGDAFEDGRVRAWGQGNPALGANINYGTGAMRSRFYTHNATTQGFATGGNATWSASGQSVINTMDIDASRSSSMYKSTSQVVPASIGVNWIIKAM